MTGIRAVALEIVDTGRPPGGMEASVAANVFHHTAAATLAA